MFHTRAFAETVFTGRKRSRKIIDLVPSLSPFFLCSFLICLWKMHLKCLFSIRNCPRCIFSFLIVLQTITFGRKCRRTASQKRSIWRMVEWLLAWAVPETKYAHQSLTEQKVLFTQKNPFQNMLIIIARSPCVFSCLPPSPTFHYHAEMEMIPVFKKHRALNRWWPPRKLCFEMALNSGWKREQPRFRRVSAHIFTSPFAMFGDHTHASKELLLKLIMFSAPENSAKE